MAHVRPRRNRNVRLHVGVIVQTPLAGHRLGLDGVELCEATSVQIEIRIGRSPPGSGLLGRGSSRSTGTVALEALSTEHHPVDVDGYPLHAGALAEQTRFLELEKLDAARRTQSVADAGLVQRGFRRPEHGGVGTDAQAGGRGGGSGD